MDPSPPEPPAKPTRYQRRKASGDKSASGSRAKVRPDPKTDMPPIEPSDPLVDRAEELLAQGLSPGRVRRMLSVESGGKFDELGATVYIDEVYLRWRAQSIKDAPYRREKIIRMCENFYVEARLAKQYTAAANTLAQLARLSGAFTQHQPEIEQLIRELGPPPSDPTMMVTYGQRAMSTLLWMVLSNHAIDPISKVRLVADLSAKLGYTYNKAAMEAKVEEVAQRVTGPQSEIDHETLDGADFAYPAHSRVGSHHPGAGALPGHVPGAPPEGDG